MGITPARRLPIGAEIVDNGVHFRVWAPGHERVNVVGREVKGSLSKEGNGYHSAFVSGVRPGTGYKYRLDGGEAYPDPASRFQPDGPHGDSQVIDPGEFRWTDTSWKGMSLAGQVIYELHVGTFTREGTWESALSELPHLARFGVTLIEVMPVADFPGSFGWGYDGVDLFAPTRLYGMPDDFRKFVDVAHSLGMGVILDVVYNHVGADGNYLGKFAPDYFSQKYTTDWGEAINFDGPNSASVREFFIANAAYWVDEFHLDGLRLDATQDIYDESEPHILAEITQAVRDASHGRTTIVIAENEPQHTRLVRPRDQSGYGMDGLWNDDLHHSAIAAMTGHKDAYYTDYAGKPQEFVSAMKYGYLFQGQRYKWQQKRRGTSTRHIPPSAFITFIQNHDQIANSVRGLRIDKETTPGLLKAMTALVLLGPGTPMLFQGQEFASSAPFLFFADVPDSLKALVRRGRQEFLEQWRSLRSPEMSGYLGDPCSLETFQRCKLDHEERENHAEIYALHADLLQLRRQDPALRSWRTGHYDGAVLGSHSFCMRVFDEGFDDRLLVFNLGLDQHLDPAPEPLLAPPDDMEWAVLFSTEHPRYGGCGTTPMDTEENWPIPGHAAVVLRPVPRKDQARTPGPKEKKG